MKNYQVLIVEDERRIARFLQMELEHEGMNTAIEDNGRRAYERIMQENYDLVLLDVMLPDMDGFTICRKVRELSQVPIIMLTAKDDIDDKVQGLDIGADDYITKPFATPELLARMRVVLRRQESQREAKEGQEEILSVKNLTMYPARHEVQVDGTPVELTKKEYDLLEYLLRNKRNVLTDIKSFLMCGIMIIWGIPMWWMCISAICVKSWMIDSRKSIFTPCGE